MTVIALVCSIFGIVLLQRFAQALAGAGSVFPFFCGVADAVAAGFAVCAYGTFCLLSGRPIASFFWVILLGLLLVVVNRTKEKVLKEPLVLLDVLLLPQVFQFPHLYFPFLPVKTIALSGAASVMILVWLIRLENPLPFSLRLALGALAATGTGIYIGMANGLFGGLRANILSRCPVSHDAVADARRNGPLTAALLHPLAAIRHPFGSGSLLERAPGSRFAEPIEILLTESLSLDYSKPHLLLLQAESLADPRPFLLPEKRMQVAPLLNNFDRLQTEGRLLPTPDGAFGAYTMRTEFGMLTGLWADTLGPWAFNPYYLAAKKPIWSLAHHFRMLGYKTVCIHPYAGKFFMRHKVMPNLGFDEFLDIDHVKHLEKDGPYVSDIALARFVIEMLERADRPTFCFVISMEAHGPWLDGRIAKDKLTLIPTEQASSLLCYLYHLSNMDKMIGEFDGYGRKAPGKFEFFAYGDHKPALQIFSS